LRQALPEPPGPLRRRPGSGPGPEALPRGSQGRRLKKLTDVLLYQLGKGKDEDWIAEQCYRRRLPLPEFIENAPQLYEWLELYWEAYQDLSTTRQAGFGGAYPISWLSIAHYAEALGYDADQKDDLFYFVSIMDREFLHWYEETHGDKQKRSGISGQNEPSGKVPGLGR
jgi:hypothetical protein